MGSLMLFPMLDGAFEGAGYLTFAFGVGESLR
jgi:hypothetical protein